MNPETDVCTVTKHFVCELTLEVIVDRNVEKKNATQKKRSKADSNSTESVSWRDKEVELLLGVVCSYSLEKDHGGLEWESMKSK